MADITKGPDTTRIDRGRTPEGPSTDLSALTMGPDVMRSEAPTLPRQTLASIEKKWGERAFDTGVMIQGRKVGGAA
jgi:hypothetical protein